MHGGLICIAFCPFNYNQLFLFFLFFLNIFFFKPPYIFQNENENCSNALGFRTVQQKLKDKNENWTNLFWLSWLASILGFFSFCALTCMYVTGIVVFYEIFRFIYIIFHIHHEMQLVFSNLVKCWENETLSFFICGNRLCEWIGVLALLTCIPYKASLRLVRPWTSA